MLAISKSVAIDANIGYALSTKPTFRARTKRVPARLVQRIKLGSRVTGNAKSNLRDSASQKKPQDCQQKFREQILCSPTFRLHHSQKENYLRILTGRIP